MWVIGGPVNNGGGTLRWVRDEFFQDEGEQASSYERLTALAETVTSGSDGLLFLPYLAGERAPLWNAHAKGVFFGLGLHHNKAHLVRSVMEGVILNLYLVMQAMEEVIGQPNKIQATGGFAHSPLWRQILADIFNTEVHVPDHIESSCLGAVILGLKAIGAIRDFQIVNDWVGTTHVHKPLSKNVAIYKELIPIFSRLSEKLQDDFTAISQFQQKWMK